MTDGNGEHKKIVIIGAGPRGLSVLERIVTIGRSMEAPADATLTVEIIDPYRPGPGRIWRTDQSGALRMNTVIGQITIFGHDPENPENDAGPSFIEWLQTSEHPGHAELEPNDYAPRRVYGEYLAYSFEHVLTLTPPWMKIVPIRDEVVQMNPDREGGYTVYLREGNVRHANVVVLTTGHPRNLLRPHEQELVDFAERHGLHYVPADSCADMPLDEVTKDDVVAVRGLGLTFYDVCARLTEDRGGKFFRDEDGVLQYEASGQEPKIVAGSRSGLPFPARGVNQKQIGDDYKPVLLTEQAVEELREKRRAENQDDRLDFKNEVLPLLMLEVHRSFIANVIRQRSGDEKAEEFLAIAEGAALTTEGLDELRSRYGVSDVELPDLDKLSRPFQGDSYESAEEFKANLTKHLEKDLVEAQLGNRYGPLKASLDVMRDLRGVIRQAVAHDGLLPDSQEWFDKWYSPRNALLVSGPPHFRVEQCVALLKAGVVEVAGPETRFRGDETIGRFVVDSPHVADAVYHATWMVEASSPDPLLPLNRSALYAQLRADGIVSEHYNPAAQAEDPDRQTGGLNVTEPPYRIVDASGQPREDLYALGIPIEHTNWFTQVGSGKPGARSSFTREARLIAEATLAQLFGEMVPRNFTRIITAIRT
jgi:hypothetical protein